MNIVVDLQACQTETRQRGIGRYSLALTKAMAAQGDEHILRIALNGTFAAQLEEVKGQFAGLIAPNMFSAYNYLPPELPLGTLGDERRQAAETVVRNHYAQLKPDVLHISNIFEGNVRAVVPGQLSLLSGTVRSATLYDLIPFIMRKEYLPNDMLKRWYQSRVEILRECDLILAISQASRKTAIDYLGILPERIVNISGAADAHFLRREISPAEAAAFLRQYGIREKFILYTGATDPRKNLAGAISGYAGLPPELRQNYQFVIVCAVLPAEKAQLLSHGAQAGLGDGEVIFTGFVPENDLVTFYNLCTLFVFPSLYEGFGLPVLEAMCCGAPVLGADNSSIPEIIGRRDALFDSKKPAAITAALYRGLTEEGYRQELQNWSCHRSKAFSWRHSAAKALAAFEAARERGRQRPVLLTVQGETVHVAEQRSVTAVETADTFAPPRILVDVSLMTQRDFGGGIARVVKNITAQLCRQRSKAGQVVPVCARAGRLYHSEGFAKESDKFLLSGGKTKVTLKKSDILLMLDTPWFSYDGCREIFSHLRRCKGLIYTVVYDLIPALYAPCLDTRFISWLASAVQESDGIICISRTVADELAAYIQEKELAHRPDLKIGYFHLGADLPATPGEETVRPVLRQWLDGQDQKVFLMVGSILPRKGHAFALEAFEKLWNSGAEAKLVILGKGLVYPEFISRLLFHPQYEKRLLWVDNPADAELIYGYGHATALLCPSAAEGYGLPLVEAAYYGLPVICSDIPVFREVAGDYATYISLENPENLAAVLRTWEIRKASDSPAKWPVLTWEQSAAKLLDIIVHNNWYKLVP